MTGFFQNMNLARGIILFSLLGSLVLGLLGWQRSTQLAEMQDALDTRVKPLVKDLMQSAKKHTTLSKALKDDNLAEQKDLETYIRRVASKEKVEIGDLNFTPSTEPRTKGVVDKVYRMRPTERERTFQRLRIANFLFTLEYDSRRVKVTDLRLEVAEKRPKPHEVPEDLWFFEAEVTSRQRAE